jgi:fructan beta-fructosidase
VNSYHGGDGSIGTLTSPTFRIERDYINFLIGGGGFKGETCMNLIVQDEVVHTATGPNIEDGGSETLDWHSWDVKEIKEKSAKIQIVDRHESGWGHILVDHIFQSDYKIEILENVVRQFTFEKKYLNLPVKNKAPERLIHVLLDNKIVREFEINLAHGEPDFWVYLELNQFKGKEASIRINRLNSINRKGFDSIYQADTFPGEDELYKEKHRPQFHFSSKRGWNNDPNGLMYYAGEYHLFYQHNPFGWPWGNMTWGHAVSKDLIHWEELGDALHPDELGTMFSGSGIVDWKNTTGFQTGDEPPLITIYTNAGSENPWSQGKPFTQGIAYSNDRGRTWTKYEGNPVQGHINEGNRDPKVIWWEETNEWVIVLYLKESRMAFFRSPNLKRWELQSILQSFHECPELFELPVDGDENNKKWILYGAAGNYFIGDFDGSKFTPESEVIEYNYGNAFYAAQTFSDVPKEDGRRIQIGWGTVPMPGMPWNQMMNFPVELTLRKTSEGIKMFSEPVKEIEKLHKKKHHFSNKRINGIKTFTGISGELFHIKAEFEIEDATSFGLLIREFNISYDVKSGYIICTGPKNEMGPERFYEPHKAPLKPIDGKIYLEIIVDRTMVEVFPNKGRYYFPMGTYLVDKDPAIKVFSEDGETKIKSVEIYELESIWY